jgi:phage baseplate assembly protein W
MAQGDFIGAGWSFPTTITPAGSVRLIGGGADIDAAIRMILSTIPGERVMRPEFGCRMWSLIFAPLTAGTLGLIEQYVREALERWEPRIELDSVVAVADQDSAEVKIELDYRLKGHQRRAEPGVPVLLDPGRGRASRESPSPDLDDRGSRTSSTRPKRRINRLCPEWTTTTSPTPASR